MRVVVAIFLAAVVGMMPGSVFAQAGVGVTVGSIQIDQTLSSGGSYNLPSIGVINTGHDAADYKVRISSVADQEELVPSNDWFTFTPEEFMLEPGGTRTISIRVKIPITAQSGDYFALVEASPIRPETGGVVISIAAATKLNFTVQSSNRIIATARWVWTRLSDWSPYSWIVIGIVVLGPLAYFIGRRVQFNVSMKKPD